MESFFVLKEIINVNFHRCEAIPLFGFQHFVLLIPTFCPDGIVPRVSVFSPPPTPDDPTKPVLLVPAVTEKKFPKDLQKFSGMNRKCRNRRVGWPVRSSKHFARPMGLLVRQQQWSSKKHVLLFVSRDTISWQNLLFVTSCSRQNATLPGGLATASQHIYGGRIDSKLQVQDSTLVMLRNSTVEMIEPFLDIQPIIEAILFGSFDPNFQSPNRRNVLQRKRGLVAAPLNGPCGEFRPH